MKSSKLEQIIGLYLDGEIPEEKKAAVEQLIKTNEEAARIYRQFRHLRDIIAATPKVTPPVDFARSVTDIIRQRNLSPRPVETQRTSQTNTPQLEKVTVFSLHKRKLLVWSSVSIVTVVLILCLIGLGTFFPGNNEEANTRIVAKVIPPMSSAEVTEIAREEQAPLAETPMRSVSEVIVPSVTVTPSSEEKIDGPVLPPLSVTGKIIDEKATPRVADNMIQCRIQPGMLPQFRNHFDSFCSRKKFNYSIQEGVTFVIWQMTRPQYTALITWLQGQTELLAESTPEASNIEIPSVLSDWSQTQTTDSPETYRIRLKVIQ